MMQRTIKNKKLLRNLISEMLSLINEEEQPRESTGTIKGSFEALEGALQSGYDAGIAEADAFSPQDQYIDIFVKEARANKDEIYVSLIKHALFVIECDKILTEIGYVADSAEQTLDLLNHPVEMAGNFGMDSQQLSRILDYIREFLEGVGRSIGFAYQMMSKGHLGGKEKVKIKLAQNTELGSNACETLENLAEFIKGLEEIEVDKAYLEIMKKEESKNWLKNKRPKYDRASSGDEYEFALERAGEFSNNIQNCKSIIQRLFDASEGLEKLLDEIVNNSEVRDDMEKAKS